MANQTRIGAPKITGGLFSAAFGTALPTDATTNLDGNFTTVGLIGEDGLEDTPDRSTDDKKAWGGATARTLQTDQSKKLKFTMIERTTQALKEVYGQDNVTETSKEKAGQTPAGTLRVIKETLEALPIRSWVADMIDQGTHLRKVFPQSQITNVSGVKYTHADLISYEVEMTCYPDENGVYSYEYEFLPTAAA